MEKLRLLGLAMLFVAFIASCGEPGQAEAEAEVEDEATTEVTEVASSMIGAVSSLEDIRALDFTAAEVADEAAPAEAPSSATIFEISPEDSKITWRGKKVAYDHIGDIDMASGEIAVDGENVVAGNFEIDMSTLTNTDLEDPEKKGQLEGHLKSEDFFNVEQFPTSSFTITGVEAVQEEGATHHISGNLMIKGNTKQITFPANVKIEGDKLMAESSFTIDRTMWDLEYSSGSVFTDLVADKIISDDMNFYIYLAAEAETTTASAE